MLKWSHVAVWIIFARLTWVTLGRLWLGLKFQIVASWLLFSTEEYSLSSFTNHLLSANVNDWSELEFNAPGSILNLPKMRSWAHLSNSTARLEVSTQLFKALLQALPLLVLRPYSPGPSLAPPLLLICNKKGNSVARRISVIVVLLSAWLQTVRGIYLLLSAPSKYHLPTRDLHKNTKLTIALFSKC